MIQVPMSSSRMPPMLAVVVMLVAAAAAQYSVPPVEIQVLSPQGLRVSIPDSPGVKLFGFHGRVNETIGSKDGSLGGDVLAPTAGRWVFEDPSAQLTLEDTLSYWVFVQHENLGYRKDKQTFRVRELVPPGTPWSTPLGPGKGECVPSKTTVDGFSKCKGEAIFTENFGRLDPARWLVEHRLAYDEQENEFTSYQLSSVAIADNKLSITPALQQLEPGFNEDSIGEGILDLSTECTSESRAFCRKEAQGYHILPPVKSGRVSTKNSFKFKYGKIEINAKLPQGDWLYPQLHLEPARPKYGVEGYDSGVIRIAFARGNVGLEDSQSRERLGNEVLSAGVLVDKFEPCRSSGAVQHPPAAEPWGARFHTYGLTWTPESFSLSVDGKSYGQVMPPPGGFRAYKDSDGCKSTRTKFENWSGKNSPFDQEFYIVLGVGAGGIADFPDTAAGKPWQNLKVKSKLKFWEGQAAWSPSWHQADRRLLVDSVKVWAL